MTAEPAGSPMIFPGTAAAEIDLGAFARNVASIAAHVAPAEMMVVVKADGYGHGMLPVARAARSAGVPWLGVATPLEALRLREAGDTGAILAWLYGPDEDLTPLVAAGVDVSASSAAQLAAIVAASATTERRVRVHLKVDTGLSRNGAPAESWAALCADAAEAAEAGAVEVQAVWSHLAAADEPGHPSIRQQLTAFDAAYQEATAAGLRPRRHLANSAAALLLPEARLDLVRVGIAAYGIDPAPGIAQLAGVRLHPVMRLRAQLVNIKRIPAGSGVSYGWTWVAPNATTVGLVPLGYADGIPRHAGNRVRLSWRGQQVDQRGTICMDQFVVELGPAAVAEVGDEVVLFGSGREGEPTAEQWASWCGTIGYEIVTRIGSRVPRIYRNGTAS